MHLLPHDLHHVWIPIAAALAAVTLAGVAGILLP